MTTHQYVVVIAIDFSHAFNTVRHATLMNKMVELNVPDSVKQLVSPWLTTLLAIYSVQNVVD